MRLFIFVFSAFFLFSQVNSAYATRYTASSIKRYVEKTPRQEEENLSSLVYYLTKPLDTDYDKARAIAFWIAGHISYDEYLYHDGKTSKLINSYRGQEPRELLKSRVGICGDFAALFAEMCKKAGIKAEIVHGYAFPGSKEISFNKLKNSNNGHAWNYFIYKGRKVYVDTTFMAKGSMSAAGRISNRTHRRALKEVKRDNKYKSHTSEFNDYYFDFDYEDEMRHEHYVHQER